MGNGRSVSFVDDIDRLTINNSKAHGGARGTSKTIHVGYSPKKMLEESCGSSMTRRDGVNTLRAQLQQRIVFTHT